jgi:hypothetical protein
MSFIVDQAINKIVILPAASEAEPVMGYDDNGNVTTTQAVDRESELPVWTLDAVIAQGKSQLANKIKLFSATQPKGFALYVPLTATNLVVNSWARDGRSGITVSAESLAVASAPAVAPTRTAPDAAPATRPRV